MSHPQPPSTPPGSGSFTVAAAPMQVKVSYDTGETLCGCMHPNRFHFFGNRDSEDVRLVIGQRFVVVPTARHESCHYIGCTCPAWETDNIQWLHNRKNLRQQPENVNPQEEKNPRATLRLK